MALSQSDPKSLFYIYDWPDLVDRYANWSDRPSSHHGVEMPHWRLHYGAGRLVNASHMEYKTSQFGLFKLLFERAKIDPRRTSDPSKAVSFFIPFDFGMHVAFFETNGRMRKTNCPLAPEVMYRLGNSTHFNKNFGHDHTLIFSINQNMNYFLNSENCVKLLRLCWNCTKLSIDEYMFIGKDRNFELKNRGVNWHAVPFPSDYHFSNYAQVPDDVVIPKKGTHASGHGHGHGQGKAASTPPLVASNANANIPRTKNAIIPPWERTNPRPIIVSFVGNSRRYNEYSTMTREALVKQCANHTGECLHGHYVHDAKMTQNQLARDSVFCLQPPGDMPTRKSLFDAVLSGCIPVLFHPLTARLMYEWHWGQKLWEEIAINYDTFEENQQLFKHQVDFIQKLITLYKTNPEDVLRRQKRLREMAFALQYSLIEKDDTGSFVVAKYKGQRDAYDIAMDHVLAIHAGTESHNRTSSYLSCMQLHGRFSQPLQTADLCNSTNSIQDPYYPPSLVSPLFKQK